MSNPTTPAPSESDRSFFGHPKGLSTLFFTEMWERFSFYGLRPLLVLFMSAAILDGGFGFDRGEASAIVGIYAACVYLSSLPGGWIADKLLGLQRAILWGAILISAGHIAIGVSAFAAGKSAFFLGLLLIVLGTGLLKPNISAIVGDLYPEDSPKRDSGFSIFYMGINIGAFAGQLITGFLGEIYGWHYGFGAAGVGMLVGLLVFAWRAKATLGDIGLEPTKDPDPVKQKKTENMAKVFITASSVIIAVVFILAATGLVILNPVAIGGYMVFVLMGLAFLFFVYVLFFAGLGSLEKKKIVVVGVLFLFAAIFWSAFDQAPTSLNLFARDFTEREIFGFLIPATWFQSVNSAFIILLAPVFAALWTWLGAKNRDLSSPAKFAAGLLITSVGFVVMLYAANIIVDGNTAGATIIKVSAWWLVWSYFFQTVGELCISSVGLSSMTKLSPKRFVGQVMGIWFLASALGNLIGGLVGGFVDPEKLDQMPKLFLITAVLLAIAGVILAIFIKPIKRMLNEKQESA
jgi:POT family proton-dependent oligopeptide transporter